MHVSKLPRRSFLKRSTAAAAAGAFVPYLFTAAGRAAEEAKNDRPNVGCIGNGGMGRGDANAVSRFGNTVAVCDVDRKHAEALAHNAKMFPKDKSQPTIYEDYRKLLERKDIQVVTISTPDHWHSRIAIAAMKAGKDIYCQKPLTLTIDEGKTLCKVLKKTGRVFQVGTQQRSENDNKFLKAVAMVQLGRIGKIKRATCIIGGGPKGGPFQKTTPPAELNWDVWLGQAPKVDYIPQRCHGTFRWWFEYSGGKMTDWGAHHVDIAQWALGMDHSGPTSIEPLAVTFPVELKRGVPTVDDCYNTANTFQILCKFANGAEILICDATSEEKNGILFEGDKGRFFVSRGKLAGKPVEELAEHPLPEDFLVKLRKGKPLSSHMENFISCCRDRSTPVSDVYTHHRAMTTCHLANLAIRLGRKLTWNPETEQIVGDDEANAWQSRPQRKGFEVEA